MSKIPPSSPESSFAHNPLGHPNVQKALAALRYLARLNPEIRTYDPQSLLDAWPSIFAWSSYLSVLPISNEGSAFAVPVVTFYAWAALADHDSLKSMIRDTLGAFELATHIWAFAIHPARDPRLAFLATPWYRRLFSETPNGISKLAALSGGSVTTAVTRILAQINRHTSLDLAGPNLHLLFVLIVAEPLVLQHKSVMRKISLYCIRQLEICADVVDDAPEELYLETISLASRCLVRGMFCDKGIKWIRFLVKSGFLRALLRCGQWVERLKVVELEEHNRIIQLLTAFIPSKRFCPSVLQVVQDELALIHTDPSLLHAIENSPSLLSAWTLFERRFHRVGQLALLGPSFVAPSRRRCHNSKVHPHDF